MQTKIPLTRVIVVIVLGALVFFLPLGLRFLGKNTFPLGDEPYLHARLALELLHKGLFTYDAGLVAIREVLWTPFHAVLAAVMSFFGWQRTMFFLPLLLGIFSFAFLVLIVREVLPERAAYATALFYALSPVSVYLATHAVPASLSILLALAGLYLLQHNKQTSAVVVLCLHALQGVVPALVSLAIYLFGSTRKKSSFQTMLLTALAIFEVLYRGVYVFATPSFVQPSGINALLSDFGALAGLSSFTVLLGIVGLFVYWKNDSQTHTHSLLALVTLVATLFVHDLLPYTSVIMFVLAGIATDKIWTLQWSLEPIKKLTLVLFICGVAFSGFSHVLLEIGEPPSPGLVQGISVLRTTEKNTTVLVHPSKAFWVSFFGQRKVLLDASWDGVSKPEVMMSSITDLFAASDLVRAEQVLQENSISKIVVTPDYAEGLVWQRQEQGLDFLLQHNEKFKKQFSNQDVVVWTYAR